MATTEKNAVLSHVDKHGDVHKLYPITKVGNVEGLDEKFDEELSTKADLTDVSSPYNFKGKCTLAELPGSGNEVNDTYYCTDVKTRYTWNGSAWYQSSLNESEYLDELSRVKTVAVSSEEPTDENTQVWITDEEDPGETNFLTEDDIAQKPGYSPKKVMSQKAVCDMVETLKAVVRPPFSIEQGGYSSNGVGNLLTLTNNDARLRTTAISREYFPPENYFDVAINSGYLVRGFCLDADSNLIKSYEWSSNVSIEIADETVCFIAFTLRKEDDSAVAIDDFWNAISESENDLQETYNIPIYEFTFVEELEQQQKGLSERQTRIEEALSIVEVLCEGKDAVSGYYDADGNIVSNAYVNRTGKIEIVENMYYTGANTNVASPVNVYFDADGNVIGTFKTVLGEVVAIAEYPENAKYIAFSIHNYDKETFKVFTSKSANINDFVPKSSIAVHNPYNLNVNLFGCDNMIWSWWYYPIAYSFNRIRDKLYWGYTTTEGYTGVAEYDFKTQFVKKTHLKKSEVDDHNALAIMVMDNGTIMCAYAGGHNSDNAMHVRLSKTPESIDFFDDEIVLKSASKTSYGQIVRSGNAYYLFYRVDNKRWAYRSTTDGKTWTDEKILIYSTMQYYCNFKPTTTDGLIRICMTSNPASEDSNIRMGFFNTTTGKVLNADGTTSLGSVNVNYSLFDIIIPNETGKTQRLFDVAITAPDKPMILYTPFSTNTDSVYKLYDSGTIHTICDGGSALWNPKYQCGASFLGSDKIVVARGYDYTDFVEVYKVENNAVTFSESIYSEAKDGRGIRNARPIVDVNGRAFLWHRGYYDPTWYTDFNTDAMIHVVD